MGQGRNERRGPSSGKTSPRPGNELSSTGAASATLPVGYARLLDDLKRRIGAARVKAALAVNRELIGLYWHMGYQISERQATEGWGGSVIDRLAKDLQASFPGVGGFSPRNIWRMRAFY